MQWGDVAKYAGPVWRQMHWQQPGGSLVAGVEMRGIGSRKTGHWTTKGAKQEHEKLENVSCIPRYSASLVIRKPYSPTCGVLVSVMPPLPAGRSSPGLARSMGQTRV